MSKKRGRPPKKKPDFRDSFEQKIVLKIKGIRYPLREYNCRTDIMFKKVFPDPAKWQESVSTLDSLILCQSLFYLLEDGKQKEIGNWENLLDIIPGNYLAKIEILKGISKCIGAGIPEIEEAADNLEKKYRETIKEAMKMNG